MYDFMTSYVVLRITVFDHFGFVLAARLSRGHICFVSRSRLDMHVISCMRYCGLMCFWAAGQWKVVCQLCAWANASESGARVFIHQAHARKPRQGPLCRRAV